MFTHRRCCVLLLAFLAAPACAAAGDKPGGRYALLVGVHQYPEAKELRPLPYCANDVTELAEALLDCGFEKNNVVVLTQERKDQRFRPLKANIRKELRALAQGRRPGDTVLVAFAGHGVQLKGDKQGYLCPADARLDDKETLLSLEDIYKELGDCKAGVRVLLVDAFRHEPLAKTTAPETRRRSLLEGETRPDVPAPPPEGVAAFFSCAVRQTAHEDDKLRHGVFSHYVIEGLRGEAANKDGKISLLGLGVYVTERVDRHVRTRSEYAQKPALVVKGLGPMVLARVDRRAALAGTWNGEYTYGADSGMAPVKFQLVLVQGDGRVAGFMREPNTFGKRNQEPWLHAFFKGEYDTESRKLSFTKSYDGTAGETHDVEYAGQLSPDGKKVAGTWQIGGGGADFKLEKVAGSRPGPHAGIWAGEQHYPKGSGKEALKFLVVLSQDRQGLTGMTREPNTSENREEPWLHAGFKGRWDAESGRLKFTKTYDGTAGVKHAVEYAGAASKDGASVEGTWSQDGSSGRFTLRRLRLDERTLDGLKERK